MAASHSLVYDVCIIGAGVVGLNIAREISRYKLDICVFDKNEDVGRGCSKANSGIVHGGYSDEPGTLKAELCLAGNRLYEQMDSELHFGYRRTGSLVLAFNDEELYILTKLLASGKKNGVTGLRLLNTTDLTSREPHLNSEVKAALLCENAGVTSPYEFAIALGENAITNGVSLRLKEEVLSITPQKNIFRITTNQGIFQSRFIVNCAGIYCDKISALVGVDEFSITPRKGQYIVLDKSQNHLVHSVIFQVPTKAGKGILVTPTFHGNLMIGPNAEEINDKSDVRTDAATLGHIVKQARRSVPLFDMRTALTSFAGNRPISGLKDWFIGESRVKKFINLIGIDSPGLTASPAIARRVVEILSDCGLQLKTNSSFQPHRSPIIKKKTSDFNGSTEATDPALRLICRCEQVTEAEITDCLDRGIPVNSLDAVKFRTRAGMGNCQGTFCGPRVRQLLADKLGILPEQIPGRGEASSTLATRARRGDLVKL